MDHSPPILNNYASLNNGETYPFHQYQDPTNFPNQAYMEGSNHDRDHQYALAGMQMAQSPIPNASLQNQNGMVASPIPNHSQQSHFLY